MIKHNGMLLILLTSTSFLFLLDCATSQKNIKNESVQDAFGYILETNATAKLKKNDKLLLALNFVKENLENTLRITLLEKEDYPHYLVGFSNLPIPRGIGSYKNITIIAYGKYESFISLKKINSIEKFPFLEPYKSPIPKKGNPPYPPHLIIIEPQIYSYTLKEDKFEFANVSMDGHLLN